MDWVILLNGDTVMAHHGLRKLAAVGDRVRHLAIVGPLSNPARRHSMPFNQLPASRVPEDTAKLGEKIALDFVFYMLLSGSFCAAIRRAALKRVEYISEEGRAVGYNKEDGLRIRAPNAGCACSSTTSVCIFPFESAPLINGMPRNSSGIGPETAQRRIRP
jgi:GT2 family glycosyltransferase